MEGMARIKRPPQIQEGRTTETMATPSNYNPACLTDKVKPIPPTTRLSTRVQEDAPA
jgi:hypothetical protein